MMEVVRLRPEKVGRRIHIHPNIVQGNPDDRIDPRTMGGYISLYVYIEPYLAIV